MSLIYINKGSEKELTPNFIEKEFYSTSTNAPNPSPLDSRIPVVAQILREHFGVSWGINSTFRTFEHELIIARAKYKGQKDAEAKAQRLAHNSRHVQGDAFDSGPRAGVVKNREIMARIYQDFEDKGELWVKLRKAGVKGFGIYNTFIHLDFRPGGGLHRDRFGSFAAWDERVKSKKKLTGTTKPTTTPTSTPAVKPVLAAS